ncbi:MAG: DUF4365 domain-containing protein [Cyanobacteria bacterium P01_H01_bin.162]
MEEISYAYIDAIAAICGYAAVVTHRFLDHAGIDVGIKVPGEMFDCLAPTIDAQVKCTSRDVIREGEIRYSLDSRNYNRLVHQNPTAPQILIVVLAPKSIDSWVLHGRKKDRISTIIKASAYWQSIKGRKQTSQNSKTVKIPIQQRLTSKSLADLMRRAAEKKL